MQSRSNKATHLLKPVFLQGECLKPTGGKSLGVLAILLVSLVIQMTLILFSGQVSGIAVEHRDWSVRSEAIFIVTGVAAIVYSFFMFARAKKKSPVLNASIFRQFARRKRTGKNFVKESHLLRTLIDTLPDYIFVKDARSRFVVNNLAHTRLLGASSQEELIGKTDFDIFPQELARQYYADDQQVIQTGHPIINKEEVTIDPEDNTHWLLTTKVPLRDKRGKIIGIAGRSHDITERKQLDDRLRELGKAFETMQLGVTITDLDRKILYTNPTEAQIHGYNVEALLGKDVGIFAPAELRQPMTREQIKTMKGSRESINIRSNGQTFPVRLMSNVVKNAGGEPIAIVTTCEDITEHKQIAEELRHHTRELTLLNHMYDALQSCKYEEQTYQLVTDACKKLCPSDSGCLCISDSSETMMKVVDFWGKPLSDSLSVPLDFLIVSQLSSSPLTCAVDEMDLLCPHHLYYPHNECLCVPIAASDEILGILSLCFDQREMGHSGQEYYQELETKRMVLNRVAEYYALTLTNLRLREKLRIESIRDPLTNLYNRRYMQDALEREAYRAKRHNAHVGIIMLDVDHFKHFNDTHGHKIGDVVLQEIGAFLLTHIRGADIACRYGGEEFLVILPDTTLETARQRAEELRQGIKQLNVMHQGTAFHITVSLGVAALPNHGPDITDTVHQSDRALYQAKAQGRDRVIVASS